MTFRKNIAAYLGGFSAGFLLFVAMTIYVVIRDGAPSDYSAILVTGTMALFLIGAIGLTAFSRSKHCLCATAQPGSQVSITWRFSFRKEKNTGSRAEMKSATLAQSTDDEGTPYFHVCIPLPNGATIDIAEGHDRVLCETTSAHFNAMVRRPSPGEIV